MGKMTCILCVEIVTALITPAAQGQARVRFDLKLESRGFPDFDANPVIDGEVGRERLFTANMVITSAGLSEAGIQGWSLGLWNAGVDINYLFLGSPKPPPPGPEACGPDPTPPGVGPCSHECSQQSRRSQRKQSADRGGAW